ncbi:MAG TPA: hypothetical protein VMK82_06300 [Steroidobacteraceae bacterium]|nr:hypothetical protein [Steroidobacteraceae bacterium]
MSLSIAPLDRRAFMCRVVWTAGSAVTAALLPVSLLEAGEVCAAVATPQYPDPCGDWTVDDMCSAYPPYAYDIRPGTLRHAPLTAQVAAADQAWVA